MSRKTRKPRNPHAKALAQKIYQPKVVPMKNRKQADRKTRGRFDPFSGYRAPVRRRSVARDYSSPPRPGN